MAPKYCCSRCFGDSGLEERIIPTLDTKPGSCSYCRNECTWVLNPRELSIAFETLLDIYVPDENGKLLSEWLMQDWSLFDHPRTRNSADAQVLLGDILDDGERARRLYSPRADFRDESAELWDSLSLELRTGNRWFPDSRIISEDRLGKWFDLLVNSSLPSEWHRARLLDLEPEPSWDALGAPPAEKATNGRVNPVGIPCLYLASDAITSISEVRPHTGGIAWVGSYHLDPVTVIDLRQPRKTVSPFKVDELDQLGALRASMGMLERLGYELSKPVQPHAAGVEYVPSQYLCELIKSRGYDGVLYRSSVSNGDNLALFDQTKAIGTGKTRFAVIGVSVDIVKIVEGEVRQSE